MNGHPPSEPMRSALDQAARSLWLTSPNPHVGCVLTAPDGALIGQGHTQRAGGPHAEIMALRDARARGHSTAGATAWVTLEPCSHHGRTGPCCEALIDAGISRVVASIADPNPRVSGNGFKRLRAAGVAVETGPGATESRELNIGFFSRMIRRTPWVRVKMAASLDGYTALNNGRSQWITSPEARTDGHAWRARSCAVLTGIGTVLDDDPTLDVRSVSTERQPHLVVLDSRMRTPTKARLFGPQRQVLIYTAVDDAEKRSALEALGATVICLPERAGAPTTRVDLAAVMLDLGRREFNELHVEAGATINGALVSAGLADEFLLYLAPKLLGQGRSMARFGPLDALEQAISLDFMETTTVGPDLRVVGRVRERDSF